MVFRGGGGSMLLITAPWQHNGKMRGLTDWTSMRCIHQTTITHRVYITTISCLAYMADQLQVAMFGVC